MESELFFICKSRVLGFPWELKPKLEFCSFMFIVGLKIIDLCFRFEDTTEGNRLMNSLEYDLKRNNNSKASLNHSEESKSIEKFNEMFKKLKELQKEERMNYLYKVLLNEQEFVLGIENSFRVLIKNLNISTDFSLSLQDIKNKNAFEYFSSRYKLAFIHFQDSKLIFHPQNPALTFTCSVNFSKQSSLLMTTQEYEELFSSYSDLKFPYLFSLDWKELITTQSQSNSNKKEKNQDLMNLLSEILLETELFPEDIDLILSEYNLSGTFCENLEFLRFNKSENNFLVSEIVSVKNVLCSHCQNSRECTMITCLSHDLCDTCRVKYFQDEYSSDCPICHRSYSLTELTILNSLNT
jgi:hypothetical protein